MASRSLRVGLFAGLALASCSTPESRIRKHAAQFAGYPAPVQEKIRAGQVEVGFTPDMVLLALGKPDAKYTRKTEKGSAEIWAYTESRPGLGNYVLSGSDMGTAAYGQTVVVQGAEYYDKTRVIFEDGKVAAVETRQK